MAQELPVSLKITSDSSGAAKDVNKLGDALQDLKDDGNQAAVALEKEKKAVDQLGVTLSKAEKDASKLASAQTTLNSALASGSITQERHNLLLAQATQRWGAHNDIVVKNGISAGQTTQAMRQLPAQITDIVTSLQGGQKPLTVLIQQGGQIKDSFGGIMPTLSALSSMFTVARVAVAGVLGVVAGLALGYKQGSEEVDAYNKAIITTGNAAGVTAGQLDGMAANIDKVVGTQAKAADVLAELTATGQVGRDNMQQFAQVTIEAERTLGQSVSETVKNFAALGKAPVEASLKLNETQHYLTASIYEQIVALKNQGKESAAAELAQKAYAATLSQQTAMVENNLGSLERAWRGVWESAKDAWDVMAGVGRQETLESKLAKAEARVKLLQESSKSIYSGSIAGGNDAKNLEAAQLRLESLKEEDRLAKRTAENQREAAKSFENRVGAEKDNAKWKEAALTTQQKLNKELQEYRQNNEKITDGGGKLDPAEVKKQEAAIRKSFEKSGGGGSSAFQEASAEAGIQMAKVKANLSLLQDTIKASDSIIVQALTDGNISLDAAYAARLAQLQTDTEAQRKALVQDKAEIDAALEKAKTKSQRGPLTQRGIEVTTKIKLLDSSLTESTRQLGIWKTEQERQLGNITAKVRVEVANLTGRFDRSAVEAQLKAQYEGEYKAAGQIGDQGEQSAARSRIDMLVSAGVAQAEFNAKLAEAQRLQQALALQEEATRTLATQGVISQTEAELKIGQARKDQAPALQSIVDRLREMRDALPPGASVAYDQMTASIGQLDNTIKATTPAVVDLGTKLKNTAIDGLADSVASAVSNFKGLRQTIADTLKGIAADILRSGVKSALNYVLKPDASGGGGGGGVFSAIVSAGKSFFGFAEGGLIRGPGTGTSDSIPALVDGRTPIAVSNEEFIQPNAAVKKYGLGFMEAVRTLKLPKPQFAFGGLVQAHQRARFATGGQVTASPGAAAPAVTFQLISNGTPQRVADQSQQFNGKDLVVSVVLEDLQRGGPISQGMRARGG